MTSGLIIYSPQKPIAATGFPIDPLTSAMNIGDCVVGNFHDYIRYVGHQFQLQTVKKISGVVYASGWYPVDELVIFQMSPSLSRGYHNIKPYLCKGIQSIHKNGWALPCDTHDFTYHNVFIALWISILEAHGSKYSVYDLDPMGNIQELEAESAIQLLAKIENLTNNTNPLYNPNAVIVVRHLSRTTRYIACSQIPANPRRIKPEK